MTVTVHVLFIFPMEVTTPLYIVGMVRCSDELDRVVSSQRMGYYCAVGAE